MKTMSRIGLACSCVTLLFGMVHLATGVKVLDLLATVSGLVVLSLIFAYGATFMAVTAFPNNGTEEAVE